MAEENRLQELIDAKEKQRFELVNSRKIEDPVAKANAKKWEKEVSALLNQQKELQTKIRTSSPKYAALKYPEPLKLPQIQQQLDRDTLLLEYSLGKKHSYVWAVTQTSITTYELPKSTEIEAAAKEFYQLLKNPGNNLYSRGAINVEPSSGSVNAIKLSRMLLQPVASQLGNKRLLIVSDGALQSVPFAALPDINPQQTLQKKQNKQNSLAGGESNYQPLLVNHEIINFPSATTIALQRKELKVRKKAPLTLAILADPVFSADDPRVTGKSSIVPELDTRSQLEQSTLKRVARNLNRSGWGRLDGTRKEAQAISQLVPASNRLEVFDFDANYNWANSPQLQQYRYLHFATHGFVDSINPELSGIVLSLFDKQGKPVRGYLRLGDIFNLNLPAELLVLSACETGLGKEVSGEGLVGLTRGLMYAGVARIVVSLWNVDDQGTAMLMQEFYKQLLQQGKSPTTALRAAQLNMWQQQKWRNPYYWSAFIFVGEWQ